jgi:hypothetical protein
MTDKGHDMTGKGHAMTEKGDDMTVTAPSPRHREERSDVAISSARGQTTKHEIAALRSQ